jgi:Ca-activated chloride channel family protein
MVSKRQTVYEPSKDDMTDVEQYLAQQAGFVAGKGERKAAAETETAAGYPFMSTDQSELDALGVDYMNNDIDGWLEGHEVQEENRRQPITPEQATAIADELLSIARLQPGESPRDMFFRYFGDGPFVLTSEEKTSTFAVDVDTASYALMRAYLNQGQLPPRESVRTEEFVNYFKADQPPPPHSQGGDPFAIGLELAPSLFASDPRTEILRVTVRGRDVADFQRQPAALTFVIDNSGSMEEGGRLELVKRALSLLLRELYAADSVAVVKFSNEASVVTELLPASRRGELESLIQALPIEGGTNAEAGLRLGYELAARNLARNAVNRVILCSDGVGNIGETHAKALLELVKESRAKGIYLNTVGVGMGNLNDAFLEELADRGDGVCNYVDSDAEAKRVFVDGLAQAIQPIARDVKIQVELDPAQVESWRLLGYENRALRNVDFKDDKIDAGEVNAGHQVTALYELVRNPRPGTVATVRVRYKPPFAIDRGDEGSRAKAEAEQALELERSIDGASVRPGFAAASGGFQRSVLVAQLAEVLRQSVHARGDSFAQLIEEAKRLEGELGDPDFTEFVALLGRANPLLDERAKEETPRVEALLDRLARLHYEQGLEERRRELEAQAHPAEKDVEALEERLGALRDELAERDAERRAEIERLEQEVRELVQREVAPQEGKPGVR